MVLLYNANNNKYALYKQNYKDIYGNHINQTYLLWPESLLMNVKNLKKKLFYKRFQTKKLIKKEILFKRKIMIVETLG